MDSTVWELQDPNCAQTGNLLHDDNALLGGSINIHIVYAGSGPPNDFEVVSSVDDIGRYLRGRSNHEAVVVLVGRGIFG